MSYHFLVPEDPGSELDTKKICELHDVMKKYNRDSDETGFRSSNKAKFSDFHLLEDLRKARQQRL